MILLEKGEVFNFEGAFRGLRNPLDSWHLADSEVKGAVKAFHMGPKDLNLAQRMIGAGTDESKFMRQIFVSVDITAPFYWWKEFDTYKIGTVANSCSTMHKIHAKEFTLDDFSHEHLSDGEYGNKELLKCIVTCLNVARENYLRTKDKEYWYQMIQLLPSSYNQLRTIDLNYEVLLNIYFARKNHKLDEWSGEKGFCKWIEKLPYMSEFLGLEEE